MTKWQRGRFGEGGECNTKRRIWEHLLHHIVFIVENLAKLCELRDIARSLDKNVNRSWTLILVPNA